ncbi:MAG: peptidylprolyl isomerase, partial [Myxococcales bacterium]|nr:peptidylprolyl isomerase [Myxococcales bacterium]
MGRSTLLLTLFFAMTACQRAPDVAAPPDPVVATIDGTPVTRSTYVEALMNAQGSAFFPRFVERFLVDREARAAGVTVTDEEVTALVDKEAQAAIEGRFQGNREAFAAQLAAYGLEIDDWRQNRAEVHRTHLLVERLLKTKVDEGRVRALFDLRFGPGGKRRKVSHIFISTVPATSRFYTPADFEAERDKVVAEAKARATKARAELAEGADFAALAAAQSDDRTASRGGDLGAQWSGRFGAAFDQAIERLSVGEISPVIESRRGFHVAQVTGVRKGATYAGRVIRVSAKSRDRDDARDEAARFAEARQVADALRTRVVGGEAFEEVARKESADALTRERGGDLGRFAPGRLGPEADAVLETLPIGEVSAPVRVSDGYLLLRLDERTFRPSDDRKLVRHLLFSTEYERVKARRLGDGLEARAKALAEELLASLTGGADFAELARTRSEDELTRRGGGALSNYMPGALGEAVEAGLAQMKVGEVRLVRGENGFHLIKLDGVIESDFAAVRAQLETELREKPVSPDDVKDYLASLRARAR